MTAMFSQAINSSLASKIRSDLVLKILLISLTAPIGCDDAPVNSRAGERIIEDMGEETLSLSDAWWERDTFSDHTLPYIEQIDEFYRISVMNREMQIVKFWITEPLHSAERLSEGGWTEAAMSRFYDGSFYQLHDEVYWYRLLRGYPVWGYDTEPLNTAIGAESIEEMYRRVIEIEEASGMLPLDLTFTSTGRLYSRRFYDEALASKRRVVLGSVLLIPERQGRVKPNKFWAFELQYSDEPTAHEVLSLQSLLQSRLPSSVSQLRWLTRSPYQEELAAELADRGEAVGVNALTYRDLIEPGVAEVYSEGITAGRARALQQPNGLTQERDILIYSSIPDELPPCRGVITSIPQTPLAHLNLLARNRGIPNIYLGGIDADPAIAQLAVARAPMLLRTHAPDEWLILPLSSDEYQRYLNLRNPPNRIIERPDLSQTPHWVEWSNQSPSDALMARPSIGGKAAGIYVIKSTLDSTNEDRRVDAPDPVLSLTGRPYAEHIMPILPTLETLLSDQTFRRDPHVRALALEGWLGVSARYPYEHDARSVAWRIALDEWYVGLDPSVRTLIDRGGVQGWIRSESVDPQFMNALTLQLRETFSSLHPRQGLRLRSSSNVEDLEGFNGAGLYASSTGFLYPRAQASSRDQQRDISRALRDTWSSYWSVEAFEERSYEGIDHLNGWMGVLVHPRFDDHHEEFNGVMTLTILPPKPTRRNHLAHQATTLLDGARALPRYSDERGLTGLVATATLNTQAGSVSVTNPDRSDLLTEVIRVEVNTPPSVMTELEREFREDEVTLEISRVQRSALSEVVLSDRVIHDLIDQALRVTRVWWSQERTFHLTAQGSETLTLDFEFRGVSVGWPKLNTSMNANPPRVVLKQARPLEPAPRGLDPVLRELPMPLDILRRAELIERWSCTNDVIEVEAFQTFTDALSHPDVGFSERPFTSHIRFTDHREEAWTRGVPYNLNHSQLIIIKSTNRQKSMSGDWSLRLYRYRGLSLPFEVLELKEQMTTDEGDQRGMIEWTPRTRDGDLEAPIRAAVKCNRHTLYASPNLYLSRVADEAVHERRGYGSHIQSTP